MMGHTHSLIGIAVGVGIATAYHMSIEASFALAGLGGFMAVLPDIDHPRAPLRRKLGVVGHVGLFWLKHRGITHTLLAVVAVAAAAYMLLPLPYALVAAGGYVSHLLADMMTITGLDVFWPYSTVNVHILPRRLRFTTNGISEHLLALVLLVLLGVHMNSILKVL